MSKLLVEMASTGAHLVACSGDSVFFCNFHYSAMALVLAGVFIHAQEQAIKIKCGSGAPATQIVGLASIQFTGQVSKRCPATTSASRKKLKDSPYNSGDASQNQKPLNML